MAAAVTPLLSMGKVTHLGPAGCGHAMKALNNYVSAAGLIASFEALATARILASSLTGFWTINSSTGRNNTTEAKIARYVVSEAYDSGFDLKLMAKDVGIAESLAAAGGFDGPLRQRYDSILRMVWKIWARPQTIRSSSCHRQGPSGRLAENLTPK